MFDAYEEIDKCKNLMESQLFEIEKIARMLSLLMSDMRIGESSAEHDDG